MTIGGEKGAVQNPLIKYATDAGWTYITPDNVLTLRGGEAGLVLKETFISQILKLNSFMTQQLAEELIKKLESIPPTIEGNLTSLEYLKGLKQIFVPDEKRERDVRFIDTDSIDKNTFYVTDEFSFTNERKTIRGDVVILINGISSFIELLHLKYPNHGKMFKMLMRSYLK